MASYIIYDVASGDISGHTEGDHLPALPEGYGAIESPMVNANLFHVVGGAIVGRETPIVPPPPPVRYTFNQWVDRFPFSAQVAIVTATTTDPVAKLIYDRAMSAGLTGSIDPTDQRTIEGVTYLVSRGYISQVEADGALHV